MNKYNRNHPKLVWLTLVYDFKIYVHMPKNGKYH